MRTMPPPSVRRPGSSWRRCARSCSGWAPPGQRAARSSIRPGQQVGGDELVGQLVAMGYRREHQVEHRGELAVRGGIVDVFPSTADVPVRIDLWGDEVDRLTAFAVSDQRSSRDLDGGGAVRLPGARAHRRGAGRRQRTLAESAVGRHRSGSAWPRASSSTAWSRGCPASIADEAGAARPAARRAPRSCWSSRGASGTGRSSCSTRRRRWPRRWPRPGAPRTRPRRSFPRLHVPFERLLREVRGRCPRLPSAPEGPSTPSMTVRGFDPVAGDPARLAGQVSDLVGAGLPGHAVRRHRARGGAPLGGAGRRRACTPRRRDGGQRHARARVVVAPPLERVRPARRQGGRAVRVRRHRPARAAPAGPAPGPGRRRLLRRPRARELRRAPPARGGPLRGRDDADHGRAPPATT